MRPLLPVSVLALASATATALATSACTRPAAHPASPMSVHAEVLRAPEVAHIADHDATVAKVKDGVPENRGGTRGTTITLDTVTGNAVFLDVGGGRFAFYAHLQPGSISVKEGDHVKKGQIIGKLGHSGNSTAPHLHFHVCTAPAGLECEGVPYVFDRFQAAHFAVSGAMDDGSFSARADRAPSLVERALPSPETLVSFP